MSAELTKFCTKYQKPISTTLEDLGIDKLCWECLGAESPSTDQINKLEAVEKELADIKLFIEQCREIAEMKIKIAKAQEEMSKPKITTSEIPSKYYGSGVVPLIEEEAKRIVDKLKAQSMPGYCEHAPIARPPHALNVNAGAGIGYDYFNWSCEKCGKKLVAKWETIK